MTDFRALCAELVETWDATADFDFNDFGHAAADIVTRARAALAQPEPQGPTDAELRELRREQEWPVVESLLFSIARAVLSRWGVPAAVPTPEAKPTPSLKEQALLVLEDIPNIDSAHYNILQRALERLND
jgi:hypothetical protein